MRRLSESLGRSIGTADLEEVRLALQGTHERERLAMQQLRDAVRVLFDAATSTEDHFFRELAVDVAKALGRHSVTFAAIAPLEGPTRMAERSRLVYTVGRSPTFLGVPGPATETQLALLFLALVPEAAQLGEAKTEQDQALAINDAIAAETVTMSTTRNRHGWPNVRKYFENELGVAGDPRSWADEEEERRVLEAFVKDLGG